MNLQIKLQVVSTPDKAVCTNWVLQSGGDGDAIEQEDFEEMIHGIRNLLIGHLQVSERVLASSSKVSLKPGSKPPIRPPDPRADSEPESWNWDIRGI